MRRFTGTWSDKNVVKNEAALIRALEAETIETVGAAVLARYDAPFMPWFLRRNEVMFEVRSDSVTR